MVKLVNKSILKKYIKKFELDKVFTNNIENFMELHVFKKGELICSKGKCLDYFYFFVEGRAKVYILSPNGKSLLIRFYSPLQVIGDVEITCSKEADCNIQAIEDCLCIGIHLPKILEIAKYDANFLNFICKHLSYKLTSTSASTSLNMLYPLENRLASYLLSIYPNSLVDEDNVMTDNFTHVAELLGSDYRHLLRIIDKLCEKKLIKKVNKKLIILDRENLSKLAVDLYN